MTLRGRLTIAFLVVVLGPVLLGAIFVGGTIATVSRNRSEEQLRLATAAVRTSISALCRQLHAAADTVAAVTDPTTRTGIANQVVARGLATSVSVTDVTGTIIQQTLHAPPGPWVDCASPAPADQRVRALAARIELRDAAGAGTGSVIATQLIDAAFVSRLAGAVGAAVTLLGGPDPADGVDASTETPGNRDAVVAAARRIRGDRIVAAEGDRYVRRVTPAPGQPLSLVLSVPYDQPQGRYAVLVMAVLLAGLLAVLAAWRLARSTTRPLAELARAVTRVASGDLTVRVPVRTQDEIGRLASTFNRMTRETQAYVQALTTSRDQLRGHLAVLGDTLSSTHDLHRILQVILQTALAATGARAGVVLLLDQATGTLIGQCAEGLEERWPARVEPAGGGAAAAGSITGSPPADDAIGSAAGDPTALRIPIGVGLLGMVAATGEPQRGRVGRDSSPLSGFEPRCETYVAVPFSAPAATMAEAVPVPQPRSGGGQPGAATPIVALGVLALYDRLGSDEFDDADLVTLRTFAGHAAVAVDNVRVHEEAQRLSLTDPLTGLWNYRYLKESIRREVERASRFGRMLSVLALDLDRFKEVNDTYGHPAGDAVLAEFARRVRGALREVDLAFRQGGEEFVVLLPETDARGAATVAERLGAAIRDSPIAVDPHPGPGMTAARCLISVTVSIGIAVFPDHATTGAQVLDAADDALYAAKAAGRDTYRVAVAAERPVGEEIPVRAGAATPEDGLPWAGKPPGGPRGGASSGPHPPRQSRGR
ncbi:diguanylate cyclase [Micromonospora sp. NPDC003197]